MAKTGIPSTFPCRSPYSRKGARERQSPAMGKRNGSDRGVLINSMNQDTIKTICVYCGSGEGAKPVYAAAARLLGRSMAEQGIALVYGGASVGLMGEIARAVLEAGGYVTGIQPANLPAHEVPLASVQEFIEVRTLHERKMLMFERADAFVALPGGVGTLEELVEQMTWVQLGHHRKPVLIANIDDYWNPLLRLFDQMRELGFISASMNINYQVADRAEDIIPMLQKASELAAGGDRGAANGVEMRGL
jgi:uncharacterized protein (TIGR00730 family)